MEDKNQNFTLVLSGGGVKWMYTCGILKAIEDCGLKSRIKAVYGVSAGALSAAYWLSGWKAEMIVERFLESQLFSFKNIAFPPKMSLLKSSVIEEFLKKDVKSDFSDLETPLYVGVTDIWEAEFKLFSQGELIPAVLWSLSIPGIFPAVEYQWSMLVDGGVMCNFPLEYAIQDYPTQQIIGVYLWQFKKQQVVRSLVDTLLISYWILMQGHLLKDLDKVNYLFKRDLAVSSLESSEEKLRELFALWYQDGMNKLSWL